MPISVIALSVFMHFECFPVTECEGKHFVGDDAFMMVDRKSVFTHSSEVEMLWNSRSFGNNDLI